MTRKSGLQILLAVGLMALAIIQFIPSAPAVLPAGLPSAEREAHRVIEFSSIHNFRDLGGYRTADGREVQWGKLYRTGTLAQASEFDLEQLHGLGLATLIDFRSEMEKKAAPTRLPDAAEFTLVAIPTLDDGNEALMGELHQRVETGDFADFDPHGFMLEANRQFATEFTPEYRLFMQQVLAADGAPVAWHCSAGKDRTGFAAAILLRTLGVPAEQVMADYLASRDLSVAARRTDLLLLRLFKGSEAADKVRVMLGVEESWLQAAFSEIDAHWGSFDRYLSEGLQLSADDIDRLRNNLLTDAG